MHIPDAVDRARTRSPRIFGQPAAVAGRLRPARASGATQCSRCTARPHGAASRRHAPTQTLAVVEALTTDDLRACAGHVQHVAGQRARHAAARRRARVRPLARRLPVRVRRHPRRPRARLRRDPFDGLRVEPADLRRACEVQARSHLLHLREGYLETRGRGDALAVLIVRVGARASPRWSRASRISTPSRPDDAAAAARHVERRLELTSGTAAAIVALVGVSEISSAEAERLFPAVSRRGRAARRIHRRAGDAIG